MAYRRTKEQPPALQQNGLLTKKLAVQYSYKASAKKQTETASSQKSSATSNDNASRSLFQYDVKLIFNDLRKTIIITLFIFIVLFGINWYLKR